MTFQTATKILTAEDIRHMYEKPVEILPAQGENTLIVVERVFAYCPDTALGFPFTKGGPLVCCYGDRKKSASDYLLPNFLTENNRYYQKYMIASARGLANMSCDLEEIDSCINAPLYLSNEASPFEEGDFSIIVYLVYLLLPVEPSTQQKRRQKNRS